MPSAEVVHVVNFMPERVIKNAQLAQATDGDQGSDAFFLGVEERRFASPDYTSVDLGALALKRLLDETGVAASDLDLILCSCAFTDHLCMGIATAVGHRVGATRAASINLDNGCTGFVTGLHMARSFVGSGVYKRVALITAVNMISRLEEFQKKPQSYPLGDGASATLIVDGKASILSSVERSFGGHYGLFSCSPEKREGAKNYGFWETEAPPLAFEFAPGVLTTLQTNALSLVPNAVKAALEEAKLEPAQVDCLITHQPNRIFLRKWRRRIGVPAERSHDTLHKYGNMFQSSIPVTLADGLENGKIKRGDVLALGTFSWGGDLVAAMTLKW
jgi:3-oxoacyl-[acyl-carrier-protein] synthase III